MYTLKGIFPEPKKEQKKNFIKDNMKQLKYIQGKTPKEPKFMVKTYVEKNPNPSGVGVQLGKVKSSPSNKATLNVGKTVSSNARKKYEVKIKKGDMAEFLKRKEMRQSKVQDENPEEDYNASESSRLRDIGCQTVETNLAQKFAESTKLTMLYPNQEEDQDAKLKASGDTVTHRNAPPYSPSRKPTEDSLDYERKHSRLNAILEKRDNRDPYLPPGYQKGVLPKYLRERKELGQKEVEGAKADDDDTVCPPGHVTLPDNERKETLRMLRNSFAELVSELNKMPVKTDTLRMRNRKMELEKQLAKLEEGIKVFSRPKVFVKIGE